MTCDCGAPRRYEDCCGRFHSGPLHLQAPDAETLMRSRYSAYVRDLIDYLRATWHPSTRPSTIEPNPPSLRWLGLNVKKHEVQAADHATVLMQQELKKEVLEFEKKCIEAIFNFYDCY